MGALSPGVSSDLAGRGFLNYVCRQVCRGKVEPHMRQDIVLRDTLAVGVHEAEPVLGGGVALLGYMLLNNRVYIGEAIHKGNA